LERKDALTASIAIAGVIGVVINLILTRERIDKQEKQSNEQIQLQMKQQRDGRFASGVELLGNPHESTRIGGAYNLYFLARDFEELRPAVCEILCAHLRSIAHKSKFETEEQRTKYPKNEVQSIIDLLFRKHETDDSGEEVSIFLNESKNLREVCLFGINFDYNGREFVAILNEVDFLGTYLIKISFFSASLTVVNFSNATLTDVNFGSATLTDVSFWKASLSNVRFLGVTLINVVFWDATLINIRYEDAILTYITFLEATLTKVNFSHVTLTDATFTNATLTSVTFTNATLTDVTFYEAILTNVSFCPPSSLYEYYSPATLINVDFEDAKFEGEEESIQYYFGRTKLEGYSIEEITREGRSLELTKPKVENPQ
jgi:uncharacterized protein YjbI with pentapeptide repeats